MDTDKEKQFPIGDINHWLDPCFKRSTRSKKKRKEKDLHKIADGL